MMYNMQEDVHRLYANITPFYLRDLNIRRFWSPQGSWNLTPADTEGRLYKKAKQREELHVFILPKSNDIKGQSFHRGLNPKKCAFISDINIACNL